MALSNDFRVFWTVSVFSSTLNEWSFRFYLYIFTIGIVLRVWYSWR